MIGVMIGMMIGIMDPAGMARATATDTPGMAILAMVTRATATDTLHMAILAMATRVTGAVTPMVVILLIRVTPFTVLAIQVVGGTPAMEGDGRAHHVADIDPGLPAGRMSGGWAVRRDLAGAEAQIPA